jgi:predicted nucleic acid-binding protein
LTTSLASLLVEAGQSAVKGDADLRRRQLTDYWAEIERLLSLNLLILTVDEDMIRAAHTERAEYGLLNNDSLVVACMRQYGTPALATNDATFERVANIMVYSATDV